MSFDLSAIPNKGDLPSAPAGPTPPSPDTIYARRKTQLENRLSRRLTDDGSLPLKVRIGFLTSGDKTQLDSDLTGMGYTCVDDESGRFVTIS
jgi:hypothetical protein